MGKHFAVIFQHLESRFAVLGIEGAKHSDSCGRPAVDTTKPHHLGEVAYTETYFVDLK